MTTFDKRSLEPHAGYLYDECLRQIADKTKVRKYLEVGVATGATLSRIPCEHAVGVDPNFILNVNPAKKKTRVSLFQMKSDDYFAKVDTRKILDGPPELVFLDGMHLFEYLLRDFFNAEAVCSPDSIIALHDCLPRNVLMAARDFSETQEASLDTPFPNWWTGDVWKVVPILQKYRPDLTVTLTDAPPTGLVLISNLDPTSDVLKKNYDAIVEEFTALPNSFDAIKAFSEENPATTTGRAVKSVTQRSFAA